MKSNNYRTTKSPPISLVTYQLEALNRKVLAINDFKELIHIHHFNLAENQPHIFDIVHRHLRQPLQQLRLVHKQQVLEVAEDQGQILDSFQALCQGLAKRAAVEVDPSGQLTQMAAVQHEAQHLFQEPIPVDWGHCVQVFLRLHRRILHQNPLAQVLIQELVHQKRKGLKYLPRYVIAISNRKKTILITITITYGYSNYNIFIFYSNNSNSNYNKNFKNPITTNYYFY